MFGFSTPITPSPNVMTQGRTVTKYVIVHETRVDWVMDTISGLLLIGLGWILGLVVIQWFGLAIGVIMVLTRIFQPENVYRADNIDDAYRILDMLDEDSGEEGL